MPPLELFPEAFRSAPGQEDYENLVQRVHRAELQQIDLGNESLFFQDDSDLEMAGPAYSFEAGKHLYITRGADGWYSPNLGTQIPKKGWLNKILGR
jgi:hypothetical protein